MFILGFGYNNIISGVSMSLIYECGYITPDNGTENFTPGTPIAEFYMGYYIWLNVIISFFCYRKHLYRIELLQRRKKIFWTVNIFCLILNIIFIISCITYS